MMNIKQCSVYDKLGAQLIILNVINSMYPYPEAKLDVY